MSKRTSQVRKMGLLARVASAVALTALLPMQSHAAEHSASGTVHFIRVHDTRHGANVDWLGIAGVEQLGNCPAYNGYVVFRIRDDAKGQRMYALSVASRMSGEPVTVIVDDSIKDAGGRCFLSSIY